MRGPEETLGRSGGPTWYPGAAPLAEGYLRSWAYCRLGLSTVLPPVRLGICRDSEWVMEVIQPRMSAGCRIGLRAQMCIFVAATKDLTS